MASKRNCFGIYSRSRRVRSNLTWRTLLKGSIMFHLIFIAVCCHTMTKMPAKLTISEADERVRKGAPIGSSVEAVIGFLDSLKVDTLSIVHNQYIQGAPT